MANGDDKRYVTVAVWDKKNAFIHKAVKEDLKVVDDRVTKYADKTDSLDKCINQINISIAKILAHQESERLNSERVINLLTRNIEKNYKSIDENKKRISVFSGGVAVLAFIFSYLWSVLKGS